MRSISFLLLIVLALTGCKTATGPSYKEVKTTLSTVFPAKSRVIIYREDKLAESAIVPAVRINDRNHVELRSGGFTMVDITPGKNQLSIGLPSDHFSNQFIKPENRDKFAVEVTLEKDQEYYFCVGCHFDGASRAAGGFVGTLLFGPGLGSIVASNRQTSVDKSNPHFQQLDINFIETKFLLSIVPVDKQTAMKELPKLRFVQPAHKN